MCRGGEGTALGGGAKIRGGCAGVGRGSTSWGCSSAEQGSREQLHHGRLEQPVRGKKEPCTLGTASQSTLSPYLQVAVITFSGSLSGSNEPFFKEKEVRVVVVVWGAAERMVWLPGLGFGFGIRVG